MIKLFDPYISEEESRVVKHVIDNKFWASGSGVNNVKKFEDYFRKYTGSKECIAVNSGTAALHLALSLFEIKNKHVLVPSMTFVTTVNSIIYNGGIPIFVDIDPLTLCIDVNDIKKKISKNTAAIIVVDFAGIPSNLTEIKNIGKKNKIPIIEDAAHSAGSRYNGKVIGSSVEAVCFSFHPVKNLAMPSGGAICINGKDSKKNKKILNSLRWCGIDNRVGYNYDVTRLGWNFYMNEISAAIGLVQLKKLDDANNIRKKIAKKYYDELNLKFKMPFSENYSFHFYWIRVKNREKFMKKLLEKGIETGIHYKPVHMMKLYKNSINLPNTEKIYKEIVSIPTHPNLSSKNVNFIIKTINDNVE